MAEPSGSPLGPAHGARTQAGRRRYPTAAIKSMRLLLARHYLQRGRSISSVLRGCCECTAPFLSLVTLIVDFDLDIPTRPSEGPNTSSVHWLPVKYCIQFKTAAFVHHVTAQRCPSYVADLVAFCSSDSQRRPLRSTSNKQTNVSAYWTLAALVKRLDYTRHLVQPSSNEHTY